MFRTDASLSKRYFIKHFISLTAHQLVVTYFSITLGKSEQLSFN